MQRLKGPAVQSGQKLPRLDCAARKGRAESGGMGTGGGRRDKEGDSGGMVGRLARSAEQRGESTEPN